MTSPAIVHDAPYSPDTPFQRELEGGKLTPVSEGTVRSAFSEAEQIDFELGSDNTTSVLPKRKPGRPKGSTTLKRLRALEALFDDPSIVGSGRRRDGTISTSQRSSSTNAASPTLVYISSPTIEFHRACQYGQLTIIEAMLRKGEVEVDCRDSGMNTPLHEAAIHGQAEVVKLLLKWGADVKAENLIKEKPAVLSSEPEISQLLQDFEKCLDISDSSQLLAGCWRGKKREIWNCLQSGAAVSLNDSLGNTGLHYAAMWDHVDVARTLLAKGMEADARNERGSTALHEACRFSSVKVIKLLLGERCDYSILNLDGHAPIYYASKAVRRIFRKFARDNDINDPEFISATATRRYVEVSEEGGDEGNGTLVEHPKSKGLSREERKLQQMLAIFSKSNNYLNDPSIPRRRRGRPLSASAIVTDEDPSPPPKSRSVELARSRITRPKIDPSYVDKSSGRTQLHKFAAKGKLEDLKKLIGEDKSLIRRKDNAGYLALHEACLHGHIGVVEELLNVGSKINDPAENGDTPLHDAVENGHGDIVRLLLSHGADRDVRNNSGKRPIDVAVDDATTAAFTSSNNSERRTSERTRGRILLESESEADARSDASPHRSVRDRGAIVETGIDILFSSTLSSKAVEIISKEPLVQIHCAGTETASPGWYFLGPQVESLYQKFFAPKKLRDSIPFSKSRHIHDEDMQRLMDSAILDKLGGVKDHLIPGALILLDKDAVVKSFDRAGGNLVNVPVMYVDLQRLTRRQDNVEASKDSAAGGSLPPKLKMKWQRKTPTDLQ